MTAMTRIHFLTLIWHSQVLVPLTTEYFIGLLYEHM
jgi:hypothetical protein